MENVSLNVSESREKSGNEFEGEKIDEVVDDGVLGASTYRESLPVPHTK